MAEFLRFQAVPAERNGRAGVWKKSSAFSADSVSIAGCSMRYEKIKQGFHVIAEGNKWIAVGPEFVDLTQSIVGFGDTPLEAITEWMQRWSSDPRSCGCYSPRPWDFEAHEEDSLNSGPEHPLPSFLL